jgi:GNAT superfamily N-acetyltransferase
MELQTRRLRLIPLSARQLRDFLSAPDRLEHALGFPVSRDLATPPLRQAIGIKVVRMGQVKPARHSWYTYWLVVVAGRPFGAGMAGFKGAPTPQGEVDIGYGIDPAYRSQGYTTEAVRALVDWAFQHPECAVVLADTRRDNLPSQRVLEKVGMRLYQETEDTLYWRLERN